MFEELAERSLMSPLTGTKQKFVRLAMIVYCQILALFFKLVSDREPYPVTRILPYCFWYKRLLLVPPAMYIYQ